jgi:Major capsid protein Gp23
MSVLLNEKWQDTKDALLEGLQGTKRGVMATCLENTKKYLLESATAGATSAGNVATLNRVILPVIRRVMPTVIANEIVGVQPMTGPVAQIHTLRVRYADTSSGDGINAGDEALSPFKIAAAYSGNNTDATPAASSVATLEGTPGKRMSIQILKQPVEAKTRKLSARWTFEAAQDAQAQQGIDIEAEIMAALAQEITTEIDQEILASLRSLASVEETYDQSLVSGTATFVGDEHAALAIQINRVANKIAQRTRRGAGNWAVVSNQALTILQSATTSAFARSTEGTFEAPTNTKFVGTLNGAMRIYVDSYLSDTGADSNQVLVGYKGSSEADAAAFYCPYIPLMSSGVVLDPATFEPVVGFMTRYGYVQLTNTASSLGNAADYLSKVSITSATVSFK